MQRIWLLWCLSVSSSWWWWRSDALILRNEKRSVDIVVDSDACGRGFGRVRDFNGLLRLEQASATAVWSAFVVVHDAESAAVTKQLSDLSSDVNCSFTQTSSTGVILKWKTTDASRLAVSMNVSLLEDGSLSHEIHFSESEASPPVALWNYTVCPGGLNIAMAMNRSKSFRSVGFGVVDSPPKSYSSITYPQGTMQWQGLLDVDTISASEDAVASVYFGAHDRLASTKYFGMRTDLESETASFYVNVIPPDAGVALRNANFSSWPIVLSVLETTDWWDLADVYRNFVLDEASWTRQGPLAQRKDVPEWLFKLTTFCNSHWQQNDIFNVSGGDPAVVRNRVTNIAKRFDLPTGGLGLHYYEWDTLGYAFGSNYTNCTSEVTCGFDTHYPEYFPPRMGFEETVRALQKADVRVFPYINGRIFDVATKSWKANDGIAEASAAKQVAEPFVLLSRDDPAAKNLDLELYSESYGSQAEFAVMDPFSQYWQDVIAGTVGNLTNDYFTDGVYVDQIAAAGPRPDFDPSHGHPLGGGDHWVSGYQTMLKKARRIAGPNKVFLTESNAEPFGADVDLFLTLVGFASGELPNVQSSDNTVIVPAFQSVYGGYFMSVGAEFFANDFNNPDVFASKIAAQFSFGVVMGWMSLGGRDNQDPYMGLYSLLMSPEYDPEIFYIRDLAVARRVPIASRFFIHGRAGRPFKVAVNGTAPTPTNAALMSSAWMPLGDVDSGDDLLFLTMTTTRRYTPVFSAKASIDLGNYGVDAIRSENRLYGVFQVSSVDASAEPVRLPGTFRANEVTFDVPIGVRSVVFLTVREVKSNEVRLVS